MEQPNYFETVATPALQQKCQEFFNFSLTLETSLRVEVAKNKFLQEKLEGYEKQNQDLLVVQTQLQQAENKILHLQNAVKTAEESARAAIHQKQQELENLAQANGRRMQEIQQTHDQLQIEYQNLRGTLPSITDENTKLKAKIDSTVAENTQLKATLDAIAAENTKLKLEPTVPAAAKAVKAKTIKDTKTPVTATSEPDDF